MRIFHQPSRPRATPAFTLIELLIVVAIIAILAAIAVPNFLEAQVRAKVSRAKADMRTLEVGLQAYHVDHNTFPDLFSQLRVLTTPVSYLSSLFPDVFRLQQTTPVPPPFAMFVSLYGYGAMPLDQPSYFALQSVGPDTDFDTYLDGGMGFVPDGAALRFYPGWSAELFSEVGVMVNSARFKYVSYDPTNGTISSGDIFRLSDHQAL